MLEAMLGHRAKILSSYFTELSFYLVELPSGISALIVKPVKTLNANAKSDDKFNCNLPI